MLTVHVYVQHFYFGSSFLKLDSISSESESVHCQVQKEKNVRNQVCTT